MHTPVFNYAAEASASGGGPGAATGNGTPQIQVERLTKRYRDLLAVDDI